MLAGAAALVLSLSGALAYILAVILFGLGAYLGWASTQFSRFICYVGTKGAQWIEANKNKQNIVINDIFLFENATDLRQSLTENYTNEEYQGTEFAFKWFYRKERDKTLVFNCSGKFKENPDESMPGSYAGARYLFAKIVERQWTEYLLANYLARIESGGVVEFNHDGKSVVRVGKDFIEFQTGNKIQRIDKSDLDLIMSEKTDNTQTKITFMKKKADGQTRETKIVIYPNELSNFDAFIKIIERYIGNVY